MQPDICYNSWTNVVTYLHGIVWPVVRIYQELSLPLIPSIPSHPPILLYVALIIVGCVQKCQNPVCWSGYPFHAQHIKLSVQSFVVVQSSQEAAILKEIASDGTHVDNELLVSDITMHSQVQITTLVCPLLFLLVTVEKISCVGWRVPTKII